MKNEGLAVLINVIVIIKTLMCRLESFHINCILNKRAYRQSKFNVFLCKTEQILSHGHGGRHLGKHQAQVSV